MCRNAGTTNDCSRQCPPKTLSQSHPLKAKPVDPSPLERDLHEVKQVPSIQYPINAYIAQTENAPFGPSIQQWLSQQSIRTSTCKPRDIHKRREPCVNHGISGDGNIDTYVHSLNDCIRRSNFLQRRIGCDLCPPLHDEWKAYTQSNLAQKRRKAVSFRSLRVYHDGQSNDGCLIKPNQKVKTAVAKFRLRKRKVRQTLPNDMPYLTSHER